MSTLCAIRTSKYRNPIKRFNESRVPGEFRPLTKGAIRAPIAQLIAQSLNLKASGGYLLAPSATVPNIPSCF